jgi:ubiquinone/menaquinone biosynthesis C-methylase UbiE
MATQTATPEAIHPQSQTVSSDPIFRLASGFMAAKHLFAASELGLFEALADSPTTIDGLAARTGLTRRAARISADAMVALGLLERERDTYRNGPAAAAFLSRSGPADVRPLLRMWDKVSFPAWCGLAEALARGPAREAFELDSEQQEIMSAGIEAHNFGPATALASMFDFSKHRRLLDVGGGTGSWSIAIAEEHPQLEAAVLDLPAVAEVASTRIAKAGLESRISVVSGDAMAERLPSGYDVFLLANLIHYWSPEQNRELLRRVREVAGAGSRLLVVDFWTNATHTEPLAAALMAGEFAVHLRNGDVYSVDEIRGWFVETGWGFVEHAPLLGPQSVVVAVCEEAGR